MRLVYRNKPAVHQHLVTVRFWPLATVRQGIFKFLDKRRLHSLFGGKTLNSIYILLCCPTGSINRINSLNFGKILLKKMGTLLKHDATFFAKSKT